MRIPAAFVLAPPALALALAATCASAHGPADAASGAPDPAAAANVTNATAAALRVVRDPVTGRLRAPTPEEAQAMQARAAASARPAAEPREIRSKHGARGLVLGEAAMSTQAARRNDKGGIDTTCVDNEESVARFLKAPAKAEVAAHE